MASDEKEFLTLAKDFERVSPDKAEDILAQNDDVVVFVARETCPYCRKFMPKLHNVVTSNNKKVYFIHSQDEQYADEVDAFRKKYGMPTVPCLMYKNEDGTKVVSDSSLSEDDIAKFIHVS